MKTDLVVAGYIFNSNRVLLIHHKKLNLWLPPGGHIKENETPDNALKREVREEVGINIEILGKDNTTLEGNIKKILPVPFHMNVHSVKDHDHCCLYYLCKTENIQITQNKNELNGFGWFSQKELEQGKIPADVRTIGKTAFGLVEQYI